MGQLVGNQPVGRAVEHRSLIVESEFGERGGAGVLHAAGGELLDNDLSVFLPRVIDAEALAEEREHVARPAERAGDVVLVAFRHVVKNRQVLPLFADHVEPADDQRHEIRDVWLVLSPVECDGLVRVAPLLNKLAVGQGLEAVGDGDDQLRGLPLIRMVHAREPVAIGGWLALAPDGERDVGLFGRWAEEEEAVLRLPHAIIDPQKGSPLRRPGGVEIDDQLATIVAERRCFFFPIGGDRDSLHLEIDGIESNAGNPPQAAKSDGCPRIHGFLGQINLEIEPDVLDVNGPIGRSPQRLGDRRLGVEIHRRDAESAEKKKRKRVETAGPQHRHVAFSRMSFLVFFVSLW